MTDIKLQPTTDNIGLISLRLTHHNAPISLLEACQMNDIESSLQEIKQIEGVDECLVLKTCNRIEIIVIGELKAKEELIRFLLSRTGKLSNEVNNALVIDDTSKALHHLLRLSSGLDSMVVGEDQILGQIQDAYETARDIGTTGAFMDLLLYKVLTIGREIRTATGIGHGAVSIGSVAVKLLEETLHDLNDKKIGIIGAGEIATLLGVHLVHDKTPQVFVANRTISRGQELASKLNGSVIALSKVGELLEKVDAVIVATSAPHSVITYDMVKKALSTRKPGDRLLIFDLCQPRNVENKVGDHPQTTLYNIDDLRDVSRKNLENRQAAAELAEKMIIEKLPDIYSILRRERVEPLISSIWSMANDVRMRELDKTFKMLRELDERERKTVEKLSQVIVSRILHTPIETIRMAATKDDQSIVFAAQKLFNIKKEENQD